MINSINLFAIVTIPLSIWLVATGRVDWWVVVFVWLMEIELTLKLRR